MKLPVKLVEEPLPGVLVIKPHVFADQRGAFVKTFHEPTFESRAWPLRWREEFYSVSAKDVVRGMHFQTPPDDHDKLVYCVSGSVLDVVVDLRLSSPTFGRWASVPLVATDPLLVLIPIGVAHGFLSLENNSVMMYKTTSVHAPASDAGIRWDSFGFSWPVASPLISDRDAALPPLADFHSPFP